MIILGIETSCDETGAAVLRGDPSMLRQVYTEQSQSVQHSGQVQILSNVVASSAILQAKFGGIIPEQAAREQIKTIIPVVEEALRQAQCKPNQLDAIAVTYGPGLIGSLLVGVETAKTLALTWNKPLIPVNHLIGHFYANFIQVPSSKFQVPTFPCIGLLVSGGHTDLVLFTDHGEYKYLGGTRDDAAGECFDKCARLLNLPYPGGPEIAAEAAKCKVQSVKCKIDLPRPLIKKKTFDFSFSGLKTAVSREVDRLKSLKQFNNVTIQQLAFEVQQAIIDVLIDKTIKAAQRYKVNQIMIAGGVASNQELVRQFKVQSEKLKVKLHTPPPKLCTDNAAMIASAAFYTGKKIDPLTLQVDPNLALSY